MRRSPPRRADEPACECSEPSWTVVADLDYLAGEFTDRDVESVSLERCRRCQAYRFATKVRGEGEPRTLGIDAERGESLLHTYRRFWSDLRRWVE